MALRLAGEEYGLVQGLDGLGFLRKIEANDADPGLIVDQQGAGAILSLREDGVARLVYSAGSFVFQEGTTIGTTSGSLTLSPAGKVTLQTNMELVDNKKLLLGSTSNFWYVYNSGGTRLELWSTNVNGAGGDGLIYQVPDGADEVVFAGGVGFFNTAPPATRQTYAPSNVTADRSYDADATTVAELADVLGTLIADLQAFGIIG